MRNAFSDGDSLEVKRRPHSETVHEAVRSAVHIAVRNRVVPLKLEVGIDVPVQPDGDVIDVAAVDATVIQVDPRVAYPDLPSAEAETTVAAFVGHEERVALRHHTRIRGTVASLAIVRPVLTGKEV